MKWILTISSDIQADDLKEAILIFITTLAAAHPDALTILLQSHTLIPSIIVFLMNLTTPYFEEEEWLMQSSDLIEAYVASAIYLTSVALIGTHQPCGQNYPHGLTVT